MKKWILLACLYYITISVFAQDEKTVVRQSPSIEMTAIQTAANLAKYGYATYSPISLIEAARIFGITEVQNANFDIAKESTSSTAEKEVKVSFKPKQLLADAKKYAGKDKVILALAKQVEKEISASTTRGVVGGPKYGEGRVYGKDYTDYTAKFWANELAEVIVIGDGDNDLDLFVYDEKGNLIASDTDYSDQCVCRWVPSWTSTFVIRIVNRGVVYSNYAIATN